MVFVAAAAVGAVGTPVKLGEADKTTLPVPVSSEITPANSEDVVAESASNLSVVTTNVFELGIGLPFMLVAVATPKTGVTRVGEVSITNFVPVPVCEATEVAFPTLVIGPVKLALVVLFPSSFCIASSILSVAAIVPAAAVYPVNTLPITAELVKVAALPVLVTSPVKSALVTTVVAFPDEVTIPVKLALVVFAAVTNAVVASWVVFVPDAAVGARGVPVNVATPATFKVELSVVAPATAKVDCNAVVPATFKVEFIIALLRVVVPPIVGEVSITNFVPVPVFEAIAVTFPELVIGPVKLALVVFAAVTNAVVASWVVFVPDAAVGARGVPVNAGEADKTTFPVPVSSEITPANSVDVVAAKPLNGMLVLSNLALVTLASNSFAVVIFASAIFAVVTFASKIFDVITASFAISAATIVPSLIIELTTLLDPMVVAPALSIVTSPLKVTS